MQRLAIFLSTGLGTGFAPVAPGTVGSLFACLLYYVFFVLLFPESNAYILPIVTLILFFIGTWATEKTIPTYGDDPKCVVVDEVVGMWLALCFVPFSFLNLAIAFALFRFFDILKPLGVGYLDRNLKGAYGVMLDDVLAGVYSNVVLQLLLFYGVI